MLVASLLAAALLATVSAEAGVCSASNGWCPVSASEAVSRMSPDATALFADVIAKDLSDDIFSAKVYSTLTAFQTGGKANLCVWFMEFILAQRGLTIKSVVTKQNDVVPTLSPAQLQVLKGFLYEFTIAAFYTSPAYKAIGLLASDILLFDKSLEGTPKNQLAGNIVWYAGQLPYENAFSITTEMPLIEHAEGGLRYKASNPSILRTDDGYIIMLRAVNYKHDHGKNFESLASDAVFRTRYYMLKADKNLTVLSKHEMSIKHVKRPVIPNKNFRNEGVEDTRLVLLNGEVWFTASAYDQSAHHAVRMVLCQLSQTPDANNEVRVVSWTPLDGPDPARNEKNWLPFVHEGRLHAFYQLGPTTLTVRLHPGTGKWDPVNEHFPSFDFSRFRGSAGPVPFTVSVAEGLLTVVHEVSFRSDGGRWYLHRFVWLDKTFTVRMVSSLFFFDHLGVEYCSGMAFGHDGALLLTAGIEEGSARLYVVSPATVRAMLGPVPSLP